MKDRKTEFSDAPYGRILAREGSHFRVVAQEDVEALLADVSFTTVTLKKSQCLLNHIRKGRVIPKNVIIQKRCKRKSFAEETPSTGRTANILGLKPATANCFSYVSQKIASTINTILAYLECPWKIQRVHRLGHVVSRIQIVG